MCSAADCSFSFVIALLCAVEDQSDLVRDCAFLRFRQDSGEIGRQSILALHLDCERHEKLPEAFDEYLPPDTSILAAAEDPNRIRRYGPRCTAVAVSNLGLCVFGATYTYKVPPAAHQRPVQCLQRSFRLCGLASARKQVLGERFQFAGKALVRLPQSAGQKSTLNDRVHAPDAESGWLVFGCQPRVLLKLGCDGYFGGGARRAENAKHAPLCQIESLRRGDPSGPQNLDSQ